jgi:hypothetical protein
LAYIGTIPAEAYTSFAVQHFTTSATDTFTLDFPVANENEIALFINNVRQEPGSGYAYTASGTTLTLASAITGSDSMYCVFIGKAVQTVTPAVGSVTNAMLAGSIATAKLADGSTFATTNGITEADQWRLTTDFTNDAQPIALNLERNDTSFSYIGTGMSQSSGVFTFPSTGIYLVKYNISAIIGGNGTESKTNPLIEITTDNSSFSIAGDQVFSLPDNSTDTVARGSTELNIIFDVTNTSTHKVRFSVLVNNSSTQTNGSSTDNRTYFTFIRLGDT